MPDHPGLADPLAGRQGVALVAGAGELEDAEHGVPADLLDLVVLDQRVREELLAELGEVRGVVRFELDEPADAHVAHAVEAERGKRPLDRLALRVEDALLGADEDARLHLTAKLARVPAGGSAHRAAGPADGGVEARRGVRVGRSERGAARAVPLSARISP